MLYIVHVNSPLKPDSKEAEYFKNTNKQVN